MVWYIWFSNMLIALNFRTAEAESDDAVKTDYEIKRQDVCRQ